MDLKQAAISISMIVFVLSSMLGMGLGLRVSEIVAPLRNWRLVMLSLVANFVVMPFAALALARLLRLDESMGIGLLLLGLAGGAPFLPKLAQIARGNLAFAVGLMVLLMVITVGYLPIVLPMLLPGVSVNPAQIARSLVLLMLLPLGSALAVNAKRPDIAARVKPFFDKTSNLSLIALDGTADVVECPECGCGLRQAPKVDAARLSLALVRHLLFPTRTFRHSPSRDRVNRRHFGSYVRGCDRGGRVCGHGIPWAATTYRTGSRPVVRAYREETARRCFAYACQEPPDEPSSGDRVVFDI